MGKRSANSPNSLGMTLLRFLLWIWIEKRFLLHLSIDFIFTSFVFQRCLCVGKWSDFGRDSRLSGSLIGSPSEKINFKKVVRFPAELMRCSLNGPELRFLAFSLPICYLIPKFPPQTYMQVGLMNGKTKINSKVAKMASQLQIWKTIFSSVYSLFFTRGHACIISPDICII